MNSLEKPRRKIHPKERANIFSKLLFIYGLKLHLKGFKQELEESDLYDVPSDYKSKKLGDRLEQEWEKQKFRHKPSFLYLIWNCYGFHYFQLGLIRLLATAILIMIQPYVFAKLISYFEPGQKHLTKLEGYFHATALVLLNFVQCVFDHNYFLVLTGFGIKIRTALCSLLYRKLLKLQIDHVQNFGKIITLITKDAQTFENFVHHGNEIWIALVKLMVIGYILYKKTGNTALAGVGFLLIILPLQIYIGTQISSIKTKMFQKADQRLRLIDEVLREIKIIKMNTWEKYFGNKISRARKREIHNTFKIFFLRFISMTIGVLNSNMAFYMLFMIYIWLGNHMTPENVYLIMTCFHLLSDSLNVFLPIAICQTAELFAANKRFGNLLEAIEIEGDEIDTSNKKPKIKINNLTTNVIQNINLDIDKGLVMIMGPIASGKTHLLQTILQEHQPQHGKMKVQGTISYVSQEPWLFPSSIKQNILFGEKYDEKRYHRVLKMCCLLEDLEILEAGDETIVIDHGNNLSKGQRVKINLARALYKECAIYLLDDCLASLDDTVSTFILEETIKKFLGNKLVMMVSSKFDYIKYVDNIIILENGKIELIAKSSEICKEMKFSAIERDTTPKISRNDSDIIDENTHLIRRSHQKLYQEQKKSGTVDFKIYQAYMQSGGGVMIFLIIIAIFMTSQFVGTYSKELMNIWVNLEKEISNVTLTRPINITIYEKLLKKRDSSLCMYTIMTITAAVTALVKIFSIFLLLRRISINLHKKLIKAMTEASMQFFSSNLIANVLNRFSKDFATVDEVLPFIIHDILQVILKSILILILIIYVNSLFLIPAMILLTVLVVFRKFYLHTGRSLKRLEVSVRSPVLGYISASLDGLITIRASRKQNILIEEFEQHLDFYTSAYYTLQCSMKAFVFFVDILCSIYIAIIIVTFLIVGDGNNLGIGLVITQVFMMMGPLQHGIHQSTEIENQMTAVERIIEYSEIKQEKRHGLVIPNWPNHGEITYHNVSLRYKNDYILKKLNFTIKPMEKIAIIGKNGAGKSSLISTLLRIFEFKGTITIDNVDITTVSLDSLRRNISMIPQEPFIFSGTIRDNIDPFRTYKDEEIWRVVDSINLKQFIPNLDCHIVSAQISTGQKQLICLARAILHNSKIVILDDITAGLDPETEILIGKIIKENFASSTVIIISHRLHFALNCDKVMILDKGEIAEYDHLEFLLRTKNRLFNEIVVHAKNRDLCGVF